MCATLSEATVVISNTSVCTDHEAAQTPVDDLPQTAMGNGLTRGRHRKGELPIPTTENIPLQEKRTPSQERLSLHEKIRKLPKHPSSLHLELPVPEFLYSEPPSACHSLNDLDQDFKLNGLNGDIGLSSNFLCVPGSLQEVKRKLFNFTK